MHTQHTLVTTQSSLSLTTPRFSLNVDSSDSHAAAAIALSSLVTLTVPGNLILGTVCQQMVKLGAGSASGRT